MNKIFSVYLVKIHETYKGEIRMFKELVNRFISEGIPFLVIPQNKENAIRISTDKANIILTSPNMAFIEAAGDTTQFEMFVDSKFESMPKILSENNQVIKVYNSETIGNLLDDYFSSL